MLYCFFYIIVTESYSEFFKKHFLQRDERRRATHNEVEKRRRDKINNWIFKLGKLLPDNENGVSGGDIKATSELQVRYYSILYSLFLSLQILLKYFCL